MELFLLIYNERKTSWKW